jgi:hypothetical protein
MNSTNRKFISLGPIERDDWIIQASLYNHRIMVIMFNQINGNYAMQYLNNEYEANIFIEYVLEKGEL